MEESYDLATREIISALENGGTCLDCGAHNGYLYDRLSKNIQLTKEHYYGIEWNEKHANDGKKRGLNILHGDLNKALPYEDDKFTCIYALSVLEHLLNGCQFLKECHRTLERNGKLVLLTPNISTYFTAILILAGKMPSSGPHLDSAKLMKAQEIFRVTSLSEAHENGSDTPVHRHLVVFSFRVLDDYLKMIGFSRIRGYGFGLYPLPNILQPIAEKLDPYHCHQMVFIAHK